MYEILLNFDVLRDDKTINLVKNLNLCKLASYVLANQKIQTGAVASINFIDADKIHSMNKQYRGIDSPTDVLSFECDGIDDEFSCINNDNFELGDIFICFDIAKKNAAKYNTSIEAELKLLTVHGMLHLCGYDHIKENEARIMESLEEQILDSWENNEQSCKR